MTSGERPNGEGAGGWLLSIDFGTTATAAVTVTGGQVSPLALDGAGRMSSSVYSAPPEAVLKVGKQADHEAGYALDRFEPTPKRRIGHPVVRLGGTSYTPAELIAAIFRRVLTEAVLQHNKAAPARVVLTHPVRWPPDQVAILAAAAHSAARESGVVLPDPEFVAEPVAAAQWYARDNHHEPLHPGQRIAVYDLGGGTFDTTVLERTADGYEVLAKGGIDHLGGYDFDYRLFTHLGDRHIGPANPGLWAALQIPNPDDVDAGWKRRQMQDSVQLLKEQLSDRTSEHTHLPGASGTVLVTRSEFEGLIDDDVDRTIEELADTMTEAGLTPKDLTAIYRIGGASRTPLVGQRLEALHVPVRTLDDPKLVVALGAS
jgi:molecular chaperone DnaK (HSP70)